MRLVFDEKSGRAWLLEEFACSGMIAAEACAFLEGGEGWMSAKLVEVLERLHPDGVRLDSAQTALVEAELALHAVKMRNETLRTAAMGQLQARACLGSYGRLLDDGFDATRQAATAIGKWIAAYAEFVQPMKIEWAGKTKRRSGNFSQGIIQLHCEKLSAAVAAAHEKHPEWPVKFAGVVRLHPRAKRPLTCVAAIVQFEGHQPLAVLWQSEVR